MFRRVAAIVGLTACCGLATVRGQAPPSGDGRRTVQDGLYTDAQALRGKGVYEQRCAECHMVDLGGHEYAGALAGFGFQLKWQDASISELYGRIRSMPLGRPGSLSADEYLEILAYVLQKNAYPPGARELTQALASQRWPRILIERVVR